MVPSTFSKTNGNKRVHNPSLFSVLRQSMRKAGQASWLGRTLEWPWKTALQERREVAITATTPIRLNTIPKKYRKKFCGRWCVRIYMRLYNATELAVSFQRVLVSASSTLSTTR